MRTLYIHNKVNFPYFLGIFNNNNNKCDLHFGMAVLILRIAYFLRAHKMFLVIELASNYIFLQASSRHG